MVNVSSFKTSLSSAEAFRSEGGDTDKKKSARATMHLLLFRLLSFLMGYPEGASAEERNEESYLLIEKYSSRLLL